MLCVNTCTSDSVWRRVRAAQPRAGRIMCWKFPLNFLKLMYKRQYLQRSLNSHFWDFVCNRRLRRAETLASDNHTFRSGLLDLLAMQMDSSHAAGSVCASHKWLYAREVMMLRGNGCATSLSIWVAGAFPFALSWMSTHRHTHTHARTPTCVHMHVCARTHTRTHGDTCAHRCMHTRAHTRAHLHAHTHTRARF